MSAPADDNNGSGCATVIGLVIVAICIGNIYGAPYGWLLFGAVTLILGLLGTVLGCLAPRRRSR